MTTILTFAAGLITGFFLAIVIFTDFIGDNDK